MKKILFIIFALVVSSLGFAQREGDKIVITAKNGTQTEYQLTGNSNAMSSLSFDTDKMEVYIKGLEAFGAWQTFAIDDISNVSFSVYKESDVTDITLADASATDGAKRLYKYLKTCYGTKIISSVMANVNWNTTEAEKIFKATGKYPAFNCYDFIHIYVPDGNGWINYNDLTPVTNWTANGGLVQLMWHFNVPTSESVTPGTDGSGVTCSPEQTTFKAANALVADTWENKWFYGQMERVTDVLLQLQQKGVSAVWRPFHEAAGNAELKSGASWGKSWFWWGEGGATTYRALWQAMFDYFQQRGVHNLIWVWTTQNYNGDATQYNDDSAWYPGDQYVDIIGRDLYGSNAEQNKQEFDEITARYPGKLVALAECGNSGDSPFSNISEIWNAGAKWAWFCPWYGINMPSEAWWKDAMSQDFVISRDDVNLNVTYLEESAVAAVKNMGLGFNLGNTLDAHGDYIPNNLTDVSRYETCWGQPVVTQEQIDFLKAGGFNAVRVPVTWVQHIDADGNVDEAWMQRVQEVVDYVISSGMYCILNVHHDTGSGTEQWEWIKADTDNHTRNSARFKNLWRQIANRFNSYSHRLLFEGYNEMLDAGNNWTLPSANSSYTALNDYAQDFVDAVRATGGNNTTRNLIINTYSAAHLQQVLDHLRMPTDVVDGHLAVEVHTYDPYDWVNTYGDWTSACSKELEGMFSRLNTSFVSKGIPCIIGEYGTHGNNVNVGSSSSDALKQAAAKQAADIVSKAKALNIATFYWMSIFDGKDRSVPQWTLPTVVDAMKSAYAE